MKIFEDEATSEIEVPSEQVFYKLEHYSRFTKPMYYELPENLLLIYPRNLETHLGLSFYQIIHWHLNRINFCETTRLITINVTPAHTMQYIDNDEMVKYWITRDFFVRLTDYHQWSIVQLLTGDLCLLVWFNEMQVDIIMFTRQVLMYCYFCNCN